MPMKMERTDCSETSAYKIQPPENYPEESIQIIIYIPVPAKISAILNAHLVPCSSVTPDVSHLASYTLCTERCFLVGKAAGA